MITLLLVLIFQVTTAQKVPVFNAASKLMPGVKWKQNSVLSADFTCRGRSEYAILGTVTSEASGTYMIVAVFLDGLGKQPELIIDEARSAASGELSIESLDYNPGEPFGQPSPRGFERSKTCKGLDLSDGLKDSLHLYWDHEFHHFESWTL